MLSEAHPGWGGASSSETRVRNMIKRIFTSLLTALLVFTLVGCGNTGESSAPSESYRAPNQTASTPTDSALPEAAPPEEFVLVSGGTFQMGSPESEPWRSEDETIHAVTLSDFYISRYEVTQAEYQAVIGENPSSFSGDDFPVDSVSWLDAVTYCNARSESERLTPRLHRRRAVCHLGSKRQRLPSAHRGGMGIRLPRRNRHPLQHGNLHQRGGGQLLG